jgi:predicted nucleotide-binding protein (sugar kinase/HSP70/actin superfamily)
MAATTVGLPRSLFFHTEGSLIRRYLEGLGVTAVLSPPSDRGILERGVSLAVDETCLPMKIHLGHVDALRGKVDSVLVPRYGVLASSHGEMCVKFWGAYDITRNVFPDLDVLSYDVDRMYGDRESKALLGLGRRLGASRLGARRALRQARRQDATERASLIAGQEKMRAEAKPEAAKILVAGHTYILDDRLMGAPILDLLKAEDVTVLRSDRIPDIKRLRKRAVEFSPGLKWAYNREQLGAIATMRDQVDGIMVLLSFPCGPDSLVAELVQRKVRDVPICVIVLDELTATGGLKTRVESFCDIVKMRRAK